MKKILKSFVLLLLVTVTAISFAGCGKVSPVGEYRFKYMVTDGNIVSVNDKILMDKDKEIAITINFIILNVKKDGTFTVKASKYLMGGNNDALYNGVWSQDYEDETKIVWSLNLHGEEEKGVAKLINGEIITSFYEETVFSFAK